MRAAVRAALVLVVLVGLAGCAIPPPPPEKAPLTIGPTAGSITRLTAGNDDTLQSVVSADGDTIAFVSEATDLTADADAPDTADVFLIDRSTGTTLRIGHADHYATLTPLSISADGRYVVFASSVAPDGTTGPRIAYLYDAADGTTTVVSHPMEWLEGVAAAHISDDGSTIVLGYSQYGAKGVFLVDRATGVERQIVGSDVPVIGVGQPSSDGTKVVYKTQTQDGGTNLWHYDDGDHLVRHVAATKGATVEDFSLVTVATGFRAHDDGTVSWSEIQLDGLQNSIQGTAVKRRQMSSGTTTTVLSSTDSVFALATSFTSDGSQAALISQFTFVPDESFATATVSRLAVGTRQATPVAAAPIDSTYNAISATGRYMVFTSPDTDLTADADHNAPDGDSDGGDLFLWTAPA